MWLVGGHGWQILAALLSSAVKPLLVMVLYRGLLRFASRFHRPHSGLGWMDGRSSSDRALTPILAIAGSHEVEGSP